MNSSEKTVICRPCVNARLFDQAPFLAGSGALIGSKPIHVIRAQSGTGPCFNAIGGLKDHSLANRRRGYLGGKGMKKCPNRPKSAPFEREFAVLGAVRAKSAASDLQLKPSLRRGRQMLNLCPVIFDLK